MASMFCKHDRIHCDECDHHVDTFRIDGETVSGKFGVESLVPKDRRHKDVRGTHGNKEYFNHGVGKWFKGVKDTEAYLKSVGKHCDAEPAD